jgi:transaldolase
MRTFDELKIKIFADGADKKGMLELNAHPLIKGLTTNPTLMRKAGIADFEAFARDILQSIRAKPVSFEVFSDDFPEMKRQARKISGWGENVYVKIPITNTRGESSLPLIRELAAEGVKLNITAILTLEQVQGVARALNPRVPAFVSVFAGRIADTGRDPVPHLRQVAAGRVALGQLPRGAEHFSSQRLRLRHHHRAARHLEPGAEIGRHGPGRAVAGHGENVCHRRSSGGFFTLITAIPSPSRKPAPPVRRS